MTNLEHTGKGIFQKKAETGWKSRDFADFTAVRGARIAWVWARTAEPIECRSLLRLRFEYVRRAA